MTRRFACALALPIALVFVGNVAYGRAEKTRRLNMQLLTAATRYDVATSGSRFSKEPSQNAPVQVPSGVPIWVPLFRHVVRKTSSPVETSTALAAVFDNDILIARTRSGPSRGAWEAHTRAGSHRT